MAAVIGIIFLIIINLIIWLLFLPYYTEKRASALQEELVSRHYDEVENMYRQMRGWRHDYHNHIQILKAHMAMKQYEEATVYLDRLEEDLTAVNTMIRTGNQMIDAILNSKLSLMKEKAIRADATVFVPKKLPVPDTDLAVLLGNLLDNAMEACGQLEASERFIRIYMDVLKGQLYLSVTNSMKGRAVKPDKPFYTTKQGGHGYGIWRVKSVVEKHGGYLNQQSEEGVFVTEVGIPIAVPEPKRVP